ncbi:SMEK domain-containing protein [Flavobacterium anhuiense]|uniref:SMEK domain-containing protein n=1 Tax=Flavobacterium anhuiense TaxID=459526 RepID=UPI0011845918|nr:SMEK domain-containing protein [Flavobacterium anhuiense]
MPKQYEEIKEVQKYIKAWLLEINFSTALCYTDINKVSEGICQRLLNMIYEYQLEDLGKEQVNFPAVDLGDDNSSKIAFQITSDTTLDKIRKSLKKFKDHDLHKRFTGA